MRYLKIIGLATMAAAVMAVGAATSSATVFCRNNANTETCSEKYPVGTVAKGSSEGSLVLETTGGTTLDTCTSASGEETLGNAGSSTTTVGGAGSSSLTWSGCTKTTTTISFGEGEVHWISGTDNGTITAKGGGVTTNTAFGSCVYGLGSEMKDWGAFVGGENPSMTINHIVVKVSGAATCAAEVRVTGKAILTSPTVGYVAAG